MKVNIDSCVIPIKAWHMSPGDSAFPNEDRELVFPEGDAAVSVAGPDFLYFLVMERAHQSGNIAISSQRIAGHHFQAVARLSRLLALNLCALHKKGESSACMQYDCRKLTLSFDRHRPL